MAHTDEPLDRPTAHRLLSNTRRQRLLTILHESGPKPVDELGTELAARETESERVDDETRHRILVSLVHSHIPYLAEHGLVEYDGDDLRVSETASRRLPFESPLERSSLQTAE